MALRSNAEALRHMPEAVPRGTPWWATHGRGGSVYDSMVAMVTTPRNYRIQGVGELGIQAVLSPSIRVPMVDMMVDMDSSGYLWYDCNSMASQRGGPCAHRLVPARE